MTKYSIGDQVWTNLDDLMIKCTIEYIHEQGEDDPLYWVDEPTEDGLTEDFLFDSLEEAMESDQTLEGYRLGECARLGCINGYPRKKEGVEWINIFNYTRPPKTIEVKINIHLLTVLAILGIVLGVVKAFMLFN